MLKTLDFSLTSSYALAGELTFLACHLQAARVHPEEIPRGALPHMHHIWRGPPGGLGGLEGGLAGVRALWKGVGVTLAKDIPFAAIFWSLLEPMRHAFPMPDPGENDLCAPPPPSPPGGATKRLEIPVLKRLSNKMRCRNLLSRVPQLTQMQWHFLNWRISIVPSEIYL